jgi:fibronectin type 3 domain-containing protein
MKSSSIFRASTRWRLCLPIILTLSVLHSFCEAATPPPVPSTFQDLYSELDNYLISFNATLNSSGKAPKYPVLYAGWLTTADANAGPQLIDANRLAGVQLELQGWKAMGAQAAMIELAFPMLYEPFFSSKAQYQQYVNFYSQVASMVHAAGMKLVVENDTLQPTGIFAGWNVGPFYATLDWAQYQQARAQTAQVVAQTMQPDYLVVLEEPDSEAANSGQSEVDTVSGASSLVSLMLTSARKAIPSLKVGAGVATFDPQFQEFTQSFVSLPLDFIDMHIYTINDGFLPNALTIASIAASAGKPVTMSGCWLYKVRDSEVNVLNGNQIMARDPFNFWEPLDSYFLQTMENLGNYTKMEFLGPFSSDNFRADLPYDSSTENLTPTQITNTEYTAFGTASEQASFTPTGMSFYKSMVTTPDTTAPTAPTGLTGFSTATTTATVSWSASTDNVGVAGYYVSRNGVRITTTAQTFYQDSGLTTATAYAYDVSAFDLAGNTSPLAGVSVTTMDLTPPSTPAHLVASVVSGNYITLTWSPSTDLEAVAGYHVYGGTTPTGLSQVGYVSATTSPSFTNYQLTPGTTYYFSVEAVDTSGNFSAMSAVLSASTLAAPKAPTKLVATAASPQQIGVTWAASTSGMPISEYRIFRGTSPSTLIQVGVTTGLSYTDYSLTAATKYFYVLQAEDTGGDLSPLSGAVAASTLAMPLAPAKVTATVVSKTQISVTWSPGQSGLPVMSYHIFRGSSLPSLEKLAVRAATTTSFTDYPVTAGTTYYYAVETVDTHDEPSAMSEVAEVTTPN